MKKEMKKRAALASDYIERRSTIAMGLKALYTEADAAMLQVVRSEQRVEATLRRYGLITKDNPELGALKEYYSALKSAEYWFDNFIQKMIDQATFDSNEGEDKVTSYDGWMADANDFARMSLLFFDRTYRDEDQRKKIFAFIEGLESHGLFDGDDYKYFTVKEDGE